MDALPASGTITPEQLIALKADWEEDVEFMEWANAAALQHLGRGMAMRRVQLALLYIFRKRPNVQIMLHAPPAVGKSFIYLCWCAQLGPRPGKVVVVIEPTVELAKNQVMARCERHGDPKVRGRLLVGRFLRQGCSRQGCIDSCYV